MSVVNNDFGTVNLATTPLEKSAFTVKDLQLLLNVKNAYQLPLAVIGLIDMNAFFAQVEQVRLGKSVDDPVVCAQWQSLIAVSYAARKYGIGRMDTIPSAKQKCPHLVIGHAAVFKKGNSYWAYEEGLPDQGTHKVSLDPYRRELRKILKLLRRRFDMVEKASVDECYIDFGRQVHQRLMSLFGELRGLSSEELLPPVPESLPDGLQWKGDIILSSEEEKEEGKEPLPLIRDWDDICILIGADLMFSARNEIYTELGYTTSGGISRNKNLAKLAAGFRKPDNQTILRTSLINLFLHKFQLVDVTGMGGKTGDMINQKLGVPPDTASSLTFIRENFTLEEIVRRLQDEQLGTRVFKMANGDNQLELNLRTDVKSMMSRKNFVTKHPVKTLQEVYDWVRVFVGDLYHRLIELDDENLNLLTLQVSDKEKGYIMRPKTISVQMTTTSPYKQHSKQAPLVILRPLEKLKEVIESMAFKLLNELLAANIDEMNGGMKLREIDETTDLTTIKITSLANLSLVISNFAKTTDTNLIDMYVGAGNALSAQESTRKMFEKERAEREAAEMRSAGPEPKIRKTTTDDNSSFVKKLFEDFNADQLKQPPKPSPKKSLPKKEFKEDKAYIKKLFSDFELQKQSSPLPPSEAANSVHNEKPGSSSAYKSFMKELIKTQHCQKCNQDVEDVFEHADFHMAMDISEKLNERTRGKRGQGPGGAEGPEKKRVGEKKRGKKGASKGQSQLTF